MLKKILIFIAGGVAGSLATYGFVKNKYEKIANEEIESVKATYSSKKKSGGLVENNDSTDRPLSFDQSDADKLKDLIQRNGYSEEPIDYKNILEGGKHMGEDVCEIISPDDYGDDDDYSRETLYYYLKDAILSDIYGNKIEDIAGTIGDNPEEHFGEYEEDAFYARNHSTKTDYEVLADSGIYSDDYPER